MANIKKKSSIVIERNPIENFLMIIKDFSKNNGRKMVTISISVLLILIISLTSYVFLTRSSEKDTTVYQS